MKLSVIIVSYNVRHFLENALNSINRAMKNIEGEIFVVDNHSDDDSPEMIREKFPDIHLIVNEKNLGFAAANNAALRRAKGEFIVLINPDTVVQEDTFTSLINFLSKNETVGLVGCKILNPDGTLQLACRRSFPTPWIAFTKVFGLSSLFPKSKIFGKYNLTYLDPDKSYEVDAVSGSFIFLRKRVYDQVGNLDDNFFMYGEDLDWCFRIQKAGWKIFYYPETQIIHYKGESTRRSNIDELKTFYDAMHVFVRKHLSHSLLISSILRLGIVFRAWTASLGKFFKFMALPFFDWLLVLLSIALGFYMRFHDIVKIPEYAVIPIILVPGLIITSTIYLFDGYHKYKHSIPRTVISVIIGFTIISSLTFFFKEFAFSRIVVGYSTIAAIFLLSFWKILLRIITRSKILSQSGTFGRRTLIVGIDETTQQIIAKLSTNPNNDYHIVGYIDKTHKQIGEIVSGIEILGSLDYIHKVIDEKKITDVIFSTETLSFKEILSVISSYPNIQVNYRMVPKSLEVIIGKTHIDHLDGIPLIDIEYKLNKTFNRVTKRVFDVLGAIILLILFFPLNRAFKEKFHYNLLPNVLSGKLSLVGSPLYLKGQLLKSDGNLVKPGLTGLLQTNSDIPDADVEKYNLLYAKNYSPLLDIKILIKNLTKIIKNK